MNASARPSTVCRPEDRRKAEEDAERVRGCVRCGVSWVCSSCSSHDRMRLKPTRHRMGMGLRNGRMPAGSGRCRAVPLDAMVGSTVNSPISVIATPRACWMTCRNRPRARLEGEEQLVVVAAGNCGRERVTAVSREPPSRGLVNRQRAADSRAPVPLASAICRTASARPSLRSMHAVAARDRPRSAPIARPWLRTCGA